MTVDQAALSQAYRAVGVEGCVFLHFLQAYLAAISSESQQVRTAFYAGFDYGSGMGTNPDLAWEMWNYEQKHPAKGQ